MRRTELRDRAAAAFYGLLAVLAIGGALTTSSVVLALVAAVLALAAGVALVRHFPVDRTW